MKVTWVKRIPHLTPQKRSNNFQQHLYISLKHWRTWILSPFVIVLMVWPRVIFLILCVLFFFFLLHLKVVVTLLLVLWVIETILTAELQFSSGNSSFKWKADEKEETYFIIELWARDYKCIVYQCTLNKTTGTGGCPKGR